MKNLFLLLLVLLGIELSAQVIKSSQTEIAFFSATPVEDIKAVNNDAKALINIKTNEFAFVVPIVGFKFEKELMEVHFNENYMESDKYKTAYFKGTVKGVVDYLKDGTYNVIASGILNIHGVDQPRDIDVELIVKNGIVSVKSTFKVKLNDHKVKIPKVVIKNIAEEVEVTVSSTLN
ncbi:MAG: YceI family protein [Flavobacteriales bacterium]|nr:YceI family protein [Flavobacteriales bacterium]